MDAVTLDTFREELREATAAHFAFVLIGGLAVAAWSEDFGLIEGGTATLYSKDLDLRRPTDGSLYRQGIAGERANGARFHCRATQRAARLGVHLGGVRGDS